MPTTRSRADADPASYRDTTEDPSIGELVAHLGEEAKHLVQVQVELAKMQALQTIAASLYDGVRLAAAAAIMGVGGICLVVALILGLGDLLDSYWLGALAAGLLLLLAGAIVLWRASETLTIRHVLPRELLHRIRDTLTGE